MTYLNIISTLLLIALIWIAFQMASHIDLMRVLLHQIKPSNEVTSDMDVKWGATTLADTLLRKIRDLERQQFTLKEILEKLEEIQEFNELSPEQKHEIYAVKGITHKLRQSNSPE